MSGPSRGRAGYAAERLRIRHIEAAPQPLERKARSALRKRKAQPTPPGRARLACACPLNSTTSEEWAHENWKWFQLNSESLTFR